MSTSFVTAVLSFTAPLGFIYDPEGLRREMILSFLA